MCPCVLYFIRWWVKWEAGVVSQSDWCVDKTVDIPVGDYGSKEQSQFPGYWSSGRFIWIDHNAERKIYLTDRQADILVNLVDLQQVHGDELTIIYINSSSSDQSSHELSFQLIMLRTNECVVLLFPLLYLISVTILTLY